MIVNPQNLQIVLVATDLTKHGKCIPIRLSLSAHETASLNLQNNQALNQFDKIQSLYVDNADSTGDLVIEFSDTQQRIEIPAGNQGYYNVLSSNPILISFTGNGPVSCVVILINFAIPGNQWSGAVAYILPPASVSNLGGIFATPNPGGDVVIGINPDGSLKFGAGGGYVLPVASEASLGGVKATPNPGGEFVAGINPDGSLTYSSASGAQVNSDWSASSGVAEILNKPTIPAAQVSSDWNSSVSPTKILNKPTIPSAQVNSDWNASSGVAEILNKPTIPAAQVSSDWNSSVSPTNILNKPTIPVGIPAGGTTDQILGKNSATDFDASWHTPSGGNVQSPSLWAANNYRISGGSWSFAAGYTLFNLITSYQVLRSAATWKVGIFLSSGGSNTIKGVVKRTLPGSLTVIDSTPILYGGVSTYNFAQGLNVSDPIELVFDWDHDYYIVFYFVNTATLGAAYVSSLTGCGNPVTGYASGDQTGQTTISMTDYLYPAGLQCGFAIT